MKSSKTVIFGALDVNALRFEINSDDTVIACDKGVLNCEKLGVRPDKIIGDFDSLGFVPDGENVTVLPVRKDETDVGFALRTAFLSGRLSVFALSECKDINIINAEYPLENAKFDPLFPLGVSNAFIEKKKTQIYLKSGLALAVWDNKSSSIL